MINLFENDEYTRIVQVEEIIKPKGWFTINNWLANVGL